MQKRSTMLWLSNTTLSEKEFSYVEDALKKIPGGACYEYIGRFEEAVAAYVGANHALATSCGTAAIHLSLLAAGIKPEDEVIVPDFCYIAAVTPIVHGGAIPVFADVRRDTWCIDPSKIEELITKKTRAILPVHMFGSISDMHALNDIARQYNLLILEDACPSLGVRFRGKHAGTFGAAGAFSFQGVKIVTSGGRGGMLVTNDDAVFERAKYYNTLCMEAGRHPEQKFYHTGYGFHYPMSQLQAAMGLAQLERLDEFVAKKRQMFRWYEERLNGIPGIALNVEQGGAFSNYWMASLVLGDEVSIPRAELAEKLREWNIDTRPFFLPVSTFPVFKKFKRMDTPVSAFLGERGLNLPSGVNLTEDDIEYIAQCVRTFLFSS